MYDCFYAIIGCLLGAIVCLFITLYSVCKELKKIKSSRDFVRCDLENKLCAVEDERRKLQKKVNEYEKMIENVKESLPF